MLRKIFVYGLVAGLIAGGALSAIVLTAGEQSPGLGMAIGYLTMLIALSAIFVAIKRQRDLEQGGVIRFWPALGLGLGISVIAGIIYSLCWEAAQSMMHSDFATSYANSTIARARVEGKSAADIARISAEMARFKVQYADPLFRLPMTFAEIFPVGVLVSLISAALLRNSRFLPATRLADRPYEQ